jgi:hypothetical protein
MIRRILLLAMGGALVVQAAVGIGPAQAAQPPHVAVDLHDAPTLDLDLTAAGPDGVAVAYQDDFDNSDNTVYGGAIGSAAPELALRPLLGRTPQYVYTERLGTVGNTFAWYGETSNDPNVPDRIQLHRTDLVTGADTMVAVPAMPFAFTGDGWLTWVEKDKSVVLVDFATGARTTLITNIIGMDNWAADRDGLLIQSLSPDTGGLRDYRLDLVTFAHGTAPLKVERLADSKDFIGSVGMSPDTVAWIVHDIDVAHPVRIALRARSGGPISEYDEKTLYIDNFQPLAVGSGRAAYSVGEPAGSFLRVVAAGSGGAAATAVDVPLPHVGRYVFASGGEFVTAVSGPPATAGVYRTAGDAIHRVGIVPTPQIGAVSVAFSAGRLYYADQSDPPAGTTGVLGLSVWSRTVSGKIAPVLSGETYYPQRASQLRDIPQRSISFSAGRGSVGSPDPSVYQWVFLDRGKVTGRATQTRPDESDSNGLINDIHPVTSGPYTLVRGKVYRPDGTLLYTRPGEGSIQSAQDDIYGNLLIYSLADYKKNTDTIWLRDLSKPKSSSNPKRLALYKCGVACPLRVAIWGDIAAWATGPSQLAVRNLTTGKSRKIAAGGIIQELTLGEGTMAWQASGYTTHLLDLTSATSKVVTLGGKGTTIALDDHYLARRVRANGAVLVYRLPFGKAHKPRLYGTLAPSGFSPNGDGRADTWSLAVDATKPLTGVTLKIVGPKSGKLFRTLTGTGPDGSVRDLIWDGRTQAGKALGVGSYRWELTAEAVDGEGALIAVNGSSKIAGTFKITAVG